MTYYELLQVDPRADPAIIRAAFHALMGDLRRHPDKGGDTRLAQKIIAAYRILSDPAARLEYDVSLVRPAVPEPPRVSERRSSRRLDCRARIDVLAEGRFLPALLSDFSGCGGRLVLPLALPHRARVSVSASRVDQAFARAEIVRVAAARGAFTHGVRWEQLDAAHLPKGLLFTAKY